MQEVLTEWTTSSASRKLSLMYFDDAYAPDVLRLKVFSLWESIRSRLMPSTRYTVLPEVRELSPVSGTLTGVGYDATVLTNVGTAAGTNASEVPDSAQVLLRWDTGAVIGSRRLRGRTFVPGTNRNDGSSGNLGAAAVTAYTNAQNDWLSAGPRLQVWHRPVNGSGGSLHPVESGVAWYEYAVLRRRRA